MAATVPSLTRQQRLDCEEQCDRTLCEALTSLARYNGTIDTNKWSRLDTRGQLKVYRRVQAPGGGTPTSVRLIGTGYIQGSLEEIERGLYCDSSSDLLGVEAVLSGQRVLGGEVLQALETRGAETPFRFAGIKWCSTYCSSSTAVHQSHAYDMLTFERMGVTLDGDNTEVAYHIVHSLEDHDDWPPDQGGSGSRPSLRLEPFALCYLYRKVSDDLVLCFIQAEYWGSSRRGVAQDILASRILVVSDAVECCKAKVLTRIVDHCRDDPAVVSNTCQRCSRTRPSTAEALHLCGICRKSVCRACGEEKRLSRVNLATSRADTQMLCVKCLKRLDRSTPATPSASSKPGKRNESRPRRHSGRDEEIKPSIRRILSLPEPSQSYNYDELLRKRANSGSCTSSTSSGRTNEIETTATIEIPVTVADPVRDRSRSNEDLYLSGRNLASDLAQLQFQRHLERHRQLDLESFHDGGRPRPPRRTEPVKMDKSAAIRTEKPVEAAQAAGHRPKVSPQRDEASIADKKKSQSEFYRDLYTEL